MLPVLQIGPFAIPLPAVLVLAGIWAAFSLAEHFAPRFKVDPNHLYNALFIGAGAGLVFARLSYIVRYPSAFIANPLSAISLNPGLLDPFAGAAFGLIAALVYGQRKSLTLWPALDALTPGLAVFAVFLGLSHLASGSAFGAPTRLPWGIDLWGAHRHPTQIYETILAGLIAWMVWPGLGFVRTQTPGRRFLIFIALSAAARLFLEAFRGDSSLVLGGLRAAQIVAWVILAASLLALNLQKQVAASNAAERKPFAPQDRG